MADDPLFKIAVRQIRSGELRDFITDYFNNNISGYVNTFANSNSFAHLTGSEIFTGPKTFSTNPNVPYSGLTGQAPSRLYVDTGDANLQSQINALQAESSGIESFSMVASKACARCVSLLRRQVWSVFSDNGSYCANGTRRAVHEGQCGRLLQRL